MAYNLDISKDCQNRLLHFQIQCEEQMRKVRNVVDDDTFDILGRAYALSGNAAREIGLLIEEIKNLNPPK